MRRLLSGLLGDEENAQKDDKDCQPELTLDVSTALGLLKNERRRHTLDTLHAVYIQDDETTLDVGMLAETVATAENDDVEETIGLTAQERKRVYVALYQCHLPKLEDAGIVRIEGDQEVRLTAEGEALYQLQRDIVDHCGGGDA